MRTYQISSKAGQVIGYYEADSAVEALAAMHAEAGYPCYVMAGEDEITFRGACNIGADGQDICGQLEDWDVVEMPASQARLEQEVDDALAAIQARDDARTEADLEAFAEADEEAERRALEAISVDADERPNDVIRIVVCEDSNVGGLFLRAHQRDGQERDIPMDEQAVIDCDGDPEAVDDEIRSQVRQDALTGTVADDCEIVGTDLLPCCAACTETGRPLGVTHDGERMCSRCMREVVGDDADWRDEPSDW